MPEPGLAPVLAGEHHPALAPEPVVRERPQRAVVVKFIVVPVLERPVGVDPGLVRERVHARAGLIRREWLAEGVAGPQREPPGPGQVECVAEAGPPRPA